MQRIILVGLNHRTAPLEVREQVSFSKEQTVDALPVLRDQVGEAAILSTCNRTEIYSASSNPREAVAQIRRFVADFHGRSPEEVSPYLYDYSDANAVKHLFRVAAGLDSMIVGEYEILGQVRDALVTASESQSAKVSIAGLFHAGVRIGRRVREETNVGRNALSISYAGVKLAQRVLGPLRGRRVLLIGAGEAGQLVAKALRTVGVSDLMIANRTFARGEQLAQSLGGRTISFSNIQPALEDVDIVIAATDSPEFVITSSMIGSAVSARRNGPLFVFDLAVPRDVDPDVASVSEVKLFNIDDLSSIAEENLAERKRAAVEAETIVEDELARFMKWWDSLDAVPIVKTLHLQAEDIRRREFERALRKMPHLAPEHVELMDSLTKSIVRRLLHDPTEFLKGQADKTHLQAVRDLFQLWDDS